jgi:hypothetical protein
VPPSCLVGEAFWQAAPVALVKMLAMREYSGWIFAPVSLIRFGLMAFEFA